MPNTPSTSFIPKQGPAKRARHTASRQVHLFTIACYVFFAATLLASLGVWLYGNRVEKQLQGEVGKLNSEITSFHNEDMERVREYNTRLLQAQQRITNSVSVVSIFDALENATVQSVSIDEFTLTREADTEFMLAAKMETATFDSALFQQGVVARNDVIRSVEVSDVAITTSSLEEGGSEGVSFIAKIGVPLAEVPYVPERTPIEVAPVLIPPPASSTASTSNTITP